MVKIIITESQYSKLKKRLQENTGVMTPQEQSIFNDIIGSLNEGDATSIISKITQYAKQGLLTASIISALIASPKIGQAEKGQIKQIAATSINSDIKNNEPVGTKPISNQSVALDSSMIKEWNLYVNWLKQKGLSGSKQMNNIEFSQQTMNNFKKENQNIKLDYSNIKRIQQGIRAYRDWSINRIKTGKMRSSEPLNADASNYMSWVLGTADDGIAGEYTSQLKFPQVYLVSIENGAGDTTKTSTSNLGYAQDMIAKK